MGVLTRHRVILHGSSFSDLSSVPINFHVDLHTDKKRLRKHSGTGILTLPSNVEIASLDCPSMILHGPRPILGERLSCV